MIIANGINMVAKLEAKMRASKFKSTSIMYMYS